MVVLVKLMNTCLKIGRKKACLVLCRTRMQILCVSEAAKAVEDSPLPNAYAESLRKGV